MAKADPNITRHNIPEPGPGDESLGHLPSGYADGGGATSQTFTIPSCGIEDCDKAIHGLFNETIKFSVQTYGGGGQQAIYLKKPQVIFAVGEKFALAKKLRPPRDKNQVLILPAISIRRTQIEQTSEDITSRGMNQFTGDIVIKRRLAPEDKDYQNLLNKAAFKNIVGYPTTAKTGELGLTQEVQDGVLLEPTLGNNIFEIFTIPQPQFFTATYDIIFWTSYHEHMNYMIETFLSSYLPQGKMFRLGTDKGYWFMAYVEDNMVSQDNFDDFASSERIIRYNFKMIIKGFVLAPNGPANPVPIRRYVSAPNIVFDIAQTSTGDILTKRDLKVPPLAKKDGSQFVLTDIEANENNLPAPTTNDQFLFKKTLQDPLTGKKRIKYVKQAGGKVRNGETVYHASDVKTLEEFFFKGDK